MALRKTERKADAFLIMVAYVLKVDYPDELFCLFESDSILPSNVYQMRLFHVLDDASENEVIEIEQLTGNEGWLKSYFEWGEQNRWYYGPLFCHEAGVINVHMSDIFVFGHF